MADFTLARENLSPEVASWLYDNWIPEEYSIAFIGKLKLSLRFERAEVCRSSFMQLLPPRFVFMTTPRTHEQEG